MKRCVSKCIGIKEEDCKEPCSFVGKKYCRLSSQYKVNPYPGCEVVKKLPIQVTPSRGKTAKIVTKSAIQSRSKTVKQVTKPAIQSKKSNSLPKEIIERVQTIPGIQETIEDLKKDVDRFPAKTLYSSLPVTVRTKVNKLVKQIDRISPGTPHKEENISELKKTLPRLLKTFRTIKLPTKSRVSNAPTINSLKRSVSIRNASAKTIQSFMKKTEERRKALFYGTICTDSGVCLALGEQRKSLLNFFQFNKFEYAKAPYNTVGAPSGNGFVKELKYEREGYLAYALLKSSLKAGSDNLAYEYLVGQYLNDVSKKLPSFIETYGLFHYPSTKERSEMKDHCRFTRPLVPFDPNEMKNVCRKAQNLCVLTQYLKDTKSFADHYNDPYFREHLSAHVFYQIYFTLHQLRKEFTHYDLHRNNILLYEPMDGQYIQYHYHGDKIVRFKSKYIVKIIDYGRCFFKNSMEYYQKICAEPTCEPMCGIKKGFSTFHMDLTMGRFVGFVNSAVKNESQDLRPLYDTYLQSKEINDQSLDSDYLKILSDTVYLKGMFTMRIKDKSFGRGYGTIEDLGKSDKIHNVSDAYKRWEEYITHPDRVQMNEKDYSGKRCLGDLHIYTDGRDLEFNMSRNPFTDLD